MTQPEGPQGMRIRPLSLPILSISSISVILGVGIFLNTAGSVAMSVINFCIPRQSRCFICGAIVNSESSAIDKLPATCGAFKCGEESYAPAVSPVELSVPLDLSDI